MKKIYKKKNRNYANAKENMSNVYIYPSIWCIIQVPREKEKENEIKSQANLNLKYTNKFVLPTSTSSRKQTFPIKGEEKEEKKRWTTRQRRTRIHRTTISFFLFSFFSLPPRFYYCAATDAINNAWWAGRRRQKRRVMRFSKSAGKLEASRRAFTW